MSFHGWDANELDARMTTVVDLEMINDFLSEVQHELWVDTMELRSRGEYYISKNKTIMAGLNA